MCSKPSGAQVKSAESAFDNKVAEKAQRFADVIVSDWQAEKTVMRSDSISKLSSKRRKIPASLEPFATSEQQKAYARFSISHKPFERSNIQLFTTAK